MFCLMVMNGLRKGRSCLGHIYTLQTIISNKKSENKDTPVCFVDAKKNVRYSKQRMSLV